jgi:formylglycine-generating enzyme required for sulfatase activity
MQGEACLVPIVLRPVDWLGHPLSKVHALPAHAKPVTQWPNRDEAFREVAVGLRHIIAEFLAVQAEKAQALVESAAPSSEAKTELRDIKRRRDFSIPGPAGHKQDRHPNWPWKAFLVLTVVCLGTAAAWFTLRWRQPIPPLAPKLKSTPSGINKVDKLSYVRLPAGTFVRGCHPRQPVCAYDAQPARVIRISDSFWMGQTLVTSQAYRGYLNTSSTSPTSTTRTLPAATDYPAVNVTWQEANDYCQWAGGRLPFEAEWEYAATGGISGGESIGWFLNDSGSSPHRVATVPPICGCSMTRLAMPGNGVLNGTKLGITATVRTQTHWDRIREAVASCAVVHGKMTPEASSLTPEAVWYPVLVRRTWGFVVLSTAHPGRSDVSCSLDQPI